MISIGFIVCKDTEEAEKIADALLEKRLVACANILSGIQSKYWWNNKIESADETLLLLKTQEKNIETVIKETRKLHSYEIPAIEFFNAGQIAKPYAKWIERETNQENKLV
ncbi:MAG: divalent-cation tolerance protein CutA [Candidatus Diapherotrites archaeon]|nr:divalent-cation tolerance protein CutA [Candidatus Diapherotrites archaeon]